jgi:predicted MPP superfamily phosphohydrolase
VGLGIYAWRIEPHWVEVVERDLPIRRLPDALVGRTLAQISDLHVGKIVDPD